jgi:hypothetical protein
MIDLADLMCVVVTISALVVAGVILIVRAIDRRRDRINLTTDYWDDPLMVGDHVELPRNPHEALR